MEPGEQRAELIATLEEFVSGAIRSRGFVRQIEGVFAACDLDEDERFSGLQSALALFGGGDRIDDERTLAAECVSALRTLHAKGG